MDLQENDKINHMLLKILPPAEANDLRRRMKLERLRRDVEKSQAEAWNRIAEGDAKLQRQIQLTVILFVISSFLSLTLSILNLYYGM